MPLQKAYFLNVSKNQVRLEVGNKTLKPLDRGECKITAAHSTFVARSVVGTENLVIWKVSFRRFTNRIRKREGLERKIDPYLCRLTARIKWLGRAWPNIARVIFRRRQRTLCSNSTHLDFLSFVHIHNNRNSLYLHVSGCLILRMIFIKIFLKTNLDRWKMKTFDPNQQHYHVRIKVWISH